MNEPGEHYWPPGGFIASLASALYQPSVCGDLMQRSRSFRATSWPPWFLKNRPTKNSALSRPPPGISPISRSSPARSGRHGMFRVEDRRGQDRLGDPQRFGGPGHVPRRGTRRGPPGGGRNPLRRRTGQVTPFLSLRAKR